MLTLENFSDFVDGDTLCLYTKDVIYASLFNIRNDDLHITKKAIKLLLNILP